MPRPTQSNTSTITPNLHIVAKTRREPPEILIVTSREKVSLSVDTAKTLRSALTKAIHSAERGL